MDGIEGLLARDFGLRPQGKAAPMAASRAAGSAWTNPRSKPPAAPSYDDHNGAPAPSLDSLFDSFKGPAPATSAAVRTKPAPAPAPAYDDDVFDTIPGLRPSRSTSSAARFDGDDVFGAAAPAYDDVFAGKGNRSAPPSYDDLLGGFGGEPQAEERKRSVVVEDDDLLGGFGRKSQAEEKTKRPVVVGEDRGSTAFDDLIPGFAGSRPTQSRKINDDNNYKPAVPRSKSTTSTGRSTDHLVDMDKSSHSEGKNVDSTADYESDSSASDQVSKSDPSFTSEINGGSMDGHQPSKAQDSSSVQSSLNGNPARKSSMEDLGNIMPKSQSARYFHDHVDDNLASSDRGSGNGMEDQPPRSTESEDDIWLTVSEIPLFTQLTSAPPPSRSPPLLRQKTLGAKENGNPQMPTYDNNDFDDDEEFERKFSDREEKERLERLEQEREMRLREENEREKRRLEKERELEQQRKRERERQAMERATKEARERAAAEARAKAEREAYQRAAVQRAHQEARERAAAEAKERVARAAAEERERATAEAKERERAAARERAASERAAAERVQQEARKRAERTAVERAAAEARERQAAAAAARQKQSTADDLETFFGVDARANSGPKQRSQTVDSLFDPQPQGRGTVNGSQRAASTSAAARKPSSATNIGDDLFDIFGATASSEVFQEVEGESEERRRARLERHQRTCERAAKALAEKNERDMQVQREQAERDRISDTLDFEIKRWAAGKEGNLRALLSTLQYILWAECGWQAVSLTDLITGAAVKKQYRKATLCIHPDKVQQKGATLQQKYIAEKVFDMLKEAWNKFNSEELF